MTWPHGGMITKYSLWKMMISWWHDGMATWWHNNMIFIMKDDDFMMTWWPDDMMTWWQTWPEGRWWFDCKEHDNHYERWWWHDDVTTWRHNNMIFIIKDYDIMMTWWQTWPEGKTRWPLVDWGAVRDSVLEEDRCCAKKIFSLFEAIEIFEYLDISKYI